MVFGCFYILRTVRFLGGFRGSLGCSSRRGIEVVLWEGYLFFVVFCGSW